MKKIRRIMVGQSVLMSLFLMLVSGCTKPGNNNTPTPTTQVPVLTTTAVNISTSVTSGGNISSDGGSAVTARGVCWSLAQNPTIADSKTSDGTGTGVFTSTLTNLSATTTYYVRAYATNSAGTGYGNTIQFTTKGAIQGTVTDFEGNVYQTVTIGTQVWMASNLKSTKYRDGTAINNVSNVTSWVNLTTGAYCDYDTTPSNSLIYGRLYNWYAATDPHNICPVGWHLPSDAEWRTLTNYLGDTAVAGGKLKETGTAHWQSPNTGATNETGFTALPGGFLNYFGAFNAMGYAGVWWSSTVGGAGAWARILNYNDGVMPSNYGNKTEGLSVRCVKD